MSKLFKSKFLLGVMVAAIMVVGFAVSTSSASAACSITTTLKVGSRSAEVTCLQTNLGVSPATGYFGSITKAAVMAFQSSHGLTADGVFGPMSRAAWMSGSTTTTTTTTTTTGSYPAGCSSSMGYSMSTGMSCAGGSTVPGCSAGAAFSSTTGQSCGGMSTLPSGCSSASGYSVTTGMACTATTGTTATSGTDGYLADPAADSSNRVSTVYESQTDQVVAGFRETARLADQTVTRVRVTFVNTDSGSSANLGKYISSASLWMGSTKLATMAVTDADRGTSNDIYTFNFSGLNAVIAKDQIGRFYVSVNANGSLDSADTDSANWTVTFLAGGVSATSPDGSYDTYPANDIIQTGLHFGKFSSNGLKATIGLPSDSPSASIVAVNATSATNGVTILKFTVQATNSDLTIRKVPIQVSSTTANVSSIINTIKLYRGSDLVDSLDGSTVCDLTTPGNTSTAINTADCTAIGSPTAIGYLFDNLSNPDNVVTSGTTAEFSVVVDLKQADGVNYTAGDTLTASFSNVNALLAADFSVQDVNGDQLTNNSSTVRVGSAIGQIQTLRVNGVQVDMGTPSYTAVTDSGNTTSVTYTIPVTLTSFGQTLYVGPTVADEDTIAGTEAFAFRMKRSSNGAEAACTSCSTNITSSDATIETTGYRLDSGSAKHFTVTVIMTTPNANNDLYAVHLKALGTWTNGALNAGNINQTLVPNQNYTTGYQFITS